MSLTKGALLQSTLTGEYFRVGYIDEKENFARISSLNIKGKRLLAPSKADCVSLEKLRGNEWRHIHRSDDPFLIPEMRLGDSNLSERIKQRRDVKWAVLEPYVASPREVQLFDRKGYAEIIREIEKRDHVLELTIRRWISDYIYFGCNKNACIGSLPKRGGKGVLRIGGNKKKVGRYGIAEKMSRFNLLLKGEKLDSWQRNERGVTAADIKKFEYALTKWWAGGNLSFRQTYRRMCKELYVQKNWIKNDDGTKEEHPLSPEHIPTFRQFMYRASAIIERLGLKQKKTGDKEYSEKYAARTGASSDIADGAIDIFDIDATPFPLHILGGLDKLVPIKNPTVWLVIARGCHAIVGFFDALTPENWDGYRLCLFNAFTPKDELLKELGFAEDDWPLYAIPHGIFVDNGPGMSEAAKEALVSQLRVERIRQPPNFPMAKALVESAIGLMQYKTADEKGAWTQKNTLRDKKNRKQALSKATRNVQEFRRLLVKKCIEHNKNFHLPKSELTQEMLDAGVDTPEAIFLWEKHRRRGDDAIELTNMEIYHKLLNRVRPTPTLSRQGITLHGNYYSCPELLHLWERHVKVGPQRGNGIKIEVLYDPLRPMRLYWFDEAGELQILLPNSKNIREQMLRSTWYDNRLNDFAYKIRAVEIEENANRRQKRNRNDLSVKQADAIVDALTASGAPVPSKGEISMARQAQQARNNAELRKKTKNYVPQDDSNFSTHTSTEVQSAPDTWNDEHEAVFKRMFRE